ncbi:FxLYD domain-containing protein [Natronobacterium texcoconense]|uniref:Uncharacterized protein n=1 Tax=Natronobacterium texcoconense TaxID=1095778 RepID=A0A1H0ZEJ5_NATTX|nr:FxLYD domain-containing protein [Natronobacterium texcoconense]SDQ25822.1 hypothetical protein SAMN04489842_0251 [Natronobacterium texcoconense]
MTRHDSRSRRRLLVAFGTGSAVALGGCLGDESSIGGDAPAYEDGVIEDVDGEERSAEEMSAAEAVAETETNESVTPLDGLSLRDHEFVLEDDFRGSTVQGTVENTGDGRIQLVEVRVRVYDDEGAQLGRYLASTGDLDGGRVWEFEVVVLESPDDVADYDVAVLGTPT